MGIFVFIFSLIALVSNLVWSYSFDAIYLILSGLFMTLSFVFGLIVLYKNKGGKSFALTGIIICLFILFSALGSLSSCIFREQLNGNLDSLFR